MKTERRHELQENELATWLGQQITQLRPYGKAILGVLILAALALFASSYLKGRETEAQQAAWSAYFDAISSPDASSFQQVADTYGGTQAAGWCLQSAGDRKLGEGVGQLFQDKQRAAESLAAAEELYQKVIDDYDRDPMLLQRAMLGLGKTLESKQDVAGAKKSYQDIVDRWGSDDGDQIAKLAASRLAAINAPDAQEWFDWFAQQEPPKSPLDDPSFFQDLPQLSDKPDLSMPQPGQLLGGAETSDETEAASSPPDGESSSDPLEGLELQLPENQPADSP